MKWRIAFFLLILLPLCFLQEGFSQISNFHKQAKKLQQKDSLEAFTYAYLDYFLEHPSVDRLSLFKDFRSEQWRVPTTPSENLALTILYSNAGYYFLKFSKITAAIEAYENAWRYYQAYNFKAYDIIEYCLKPLGNAYTMVGDYASAENIIKSYLLKAGAQGNEEQQVSALVNLSIVYYSTGQFDAAIHVLTQALTFGVSEHKGNIYTNLARNYLQLKDYENAIKVATHIIQIKGASNSQLINANSTLAMVYWQKSDTSSAIQYAEQAKILTNNDPNIEPRSWAKINAQYAQLLGVTGQRDEALNIFKNTLVRLIPRFNSYKQLPADSLLFPENTLKEIFDGMAALYAKDGRLKQALRCYDKSFVVEGLLKLTYNYDEAKYVQQIENRDRVEKAIAINIVLYQKEKNDGYLYQAFALAENTKSIALKDQYFNNNAWKKLSNDSLYNKRKTLLKHMAALETSLVIEQNKGATANMVSIKSLIDEKNTTMLSIKALERTMHWEGANQINIDELQAKIQADQLNLIEYFFGANACYVFTLNGQNIEVNRIDNMDGVRKTVTQFTQLFTDEVKINAAPEIYAGLAKRLYDMLLPKDLEGTLLIVPDGLLNFVPFEALLTDTTSSLNYQNWPWLIKNNAVLYQYSASLYIRKEASIFSDAEKVLGFFPQFEGTDRFLNYSKNEEESIQQYFKGQFLDNAQATKQAFIRQANKFPIVHLSTHAQAGSLHEPPSITFIDSVLYLPEIHGLELHTDLLVLGACETGIGKLYKGESPLSLAGGFSYVGVQNVMFSLWKVNDYATAKLMAYFYRHLDNKPQPYRALHQAKLDYLLDTEVSVDKKSPYYWASFVYYGHVKTKESTGWPTIWLYVLGSILLLVVTAGGVYWYLGTKKSKTSFS